MFLYFPFLSLIYILVETFERFDWNISVTMQKQSDLLLNADDLDAMWVCLRENCVIDDATGAEKVLNKGNLCDAIH